MKIIREKRNTGCYTRPTFARVSQNVAAAAVQLDTLPTPSTNGVNKVYHQLMGILDEATEL
jgi:hypothetical protein